LKRFRGEEAGAEVRFACLTGDSLAGDQSERETGSEGEDTRGVEANLQDCSHPSEGFGEYEPANFPSEGDEEETASELGVRSSRPSTRYPHSEWVRAMTSIGPLDLRRSPVTIQVDATLLEKGRNRDKAGTAWRIRKDPSTELLAAGEFEGLHWQSLRRRDATGKKRETPKPHSILIRRGDLVAEVEKYLNDCVFIPAFEKARRLGEARNPKRVQ
jgi:hypothetical protein